MDKEDMMDGPRRYSVSELRQRETSTELFHLYAESKKPKQLNEINRNRCTDIENKLLVAKGERVGGMGEKTTKNILLNIYC